MDGHEYTHVNECEEKAAELLMEKAADVLTIIGKQIKGMSKEAKLREAIQWSNFSDAAVALMEKFMDS